MDDKQNHFFDIGIKQDDDFSKHCLTLDVYIRLIGLKSGDILILSDLSKTNYYTLIVGDCMPQIAPCTSDLGNGWNYDDAKKFIVVEKRHIYMQSPEVDINSIPPHRWKGN